MEILLRLGALILSLFSSLLNLLLDLLWQRRKPNYPPIRDAILIKPVTELVTELHRGQLKSVDIVQAYIARVREVNPALNAVIEERFEAALKESQLADDFIAKATTDYDRVALFARYPLLGIPFSVKESCAVRGLSYEVGSVVRKNLKAPKDGDVVELLRSSGGIPMLVSATPEFCLGLETSSMEKGRCINPYDISRTAAGSSGGEAALNGCGATPFGVGSDIAGSIRLPAMFCGVFGHKPTGGLVSVKGHFPYSTSDKNFANYLQLGPITRFARDLPLLVELMAGDNKNKLKLNEPVSLKDIKIFYAYGFSGFNALTRPCVDVEIKQSITKAVKCFENGGLQTKELNLDFLHNSMEIALVALVDLEGIPSIITHQAHRKPHMRMLLMEMFNSLIGHSLFTKEAVIAELMHRWKGTMCPRHMQKYRDEVPKLKEHLTELLGTDGVLLMPTFHTSALCFNTSMLNYVGVDNMLIFNVLGFPATHVTMGLNKRGMPIGLQVIAAPYQDKLCFQIAAELEAAFHGWVPPEPHEL